MESYFSLNAHEDWDKNEEHNTYYTQVYTHFAALAGMELEYFGSDSSSHEFKIDDIIFKVLEDPADGWRSSLGVIEYGNESNAIFFCQPLATITVETYTGERVDNQYGDGLNRGYRLVDINDGHIWLEFGTDNYNDYYPMFIFRHFPKECKEKV